MTVAAASLLAAAVHRTRSTAPMQLPRRWTPAEYRLLRQCWERGEPDRQIALRLGRTPAAVLQQRRKIGCDDGRPDTEPEWTLAPRGALTAFDAPRPDEAGARLVMIMMVDGIAVRVPLTADALRNAARLIRDELGPAEDEGS